MGTIRRPVMLSAARARRSGVALQSGCAFGNIVGRSENGEPLVDYPGHVGEPMTARSIASTSGLADGAEVVLAFENGDGRRPIIVGVPVPAQAPGSAQEVPLRTGQQLILEADAFRFEAQREIVLRCGKGSITVRRDGTVVIRGTNLLSRSSGPNRVKGATVKLN